MLKKNIPKVRISAILIAMITMMILYLFFSVYLFNLDSKVEYGIYQTSITEFQFDTPMLNLLEDGSFNLSERGIIDSTIVRGEYELKDNHIILTPSNNDDKYYFTVGRKRLIYKADISADLGIKNNTPFYFNGEVMKTQTRT